jgi:hypothetical protein
MARSSASRAHGRRSGNGTRASRRSARTGLRPDRSVAQPTAVRQTFHPPALGREGGESIRVCLGELQSAQAWTGSGEGSGLPQLVVEHPTVHDRPAQLGIPTIPHWAPQGVTRAFVVGINLCVDPVAGLRLGALQFAHHRRVAAVGPPVEGVVNGIHLSMFANLTAVANSQTRRLPGRQCVTAQPFCRIGRSCLMVAPLPLAVMMYHNRNDSRSSVSPRKIAGGVMTRAQAPRTHPGAAWRPAP